MDWFLYDNGFRHERVKNKILNPFPLDTGRKLNVHKTSGRPLNVLCTLNLPPVPRGFKALSRGFLLSSGEIDKEYYSEMKFCAVFTVVMFNLRRNTTVFN